MGWQGRQSLCDLEAILFCYFIIIPFFWLHEARFAPKEIKRLSHPLRTMFLKGQKNQKKQKTLTRQSG